MINIEDVYAYLSENEPDIANQICYASEMLLSNIDKAIEALKNHRINATASDNDEELERLTNYRDRLKDYKEEINAYLNYATRETQPDSNEKEDLSQVEIENIAIDDEERIGRHVQRCMRELEAKHYNFTQNELLALLNKQQSKIIFGINFPFFVDSENKIYDNNGYKRYWTKTYKFNGKSYYITSEWYDYNREKFDAWFRSINRNNR